MAVLRVALVGCLMLAIATAGLAGEKAKIDKAKLMGTWTFVKTNDEKEAPPEGATMKVEFAKDGKMSINMTLKDKSRKLSGSWSVKGDQLTTVVKVRDEEKKETVTISELTDKKLVLSEKKDGKTITTEFKK